EPRGRRGADHRDPCGGPGREGGEGAGAPGRTAGAAMNAWTLIHRGIQFYRRTHLGVIAGCAISAAVLTGALFVGDSVKGSLERVALARLGRIHVALDSSSRYVRDDLARRVRDGLKTDVAAALHVQAMGLR